MGEGEDLPARIQKSTSCIETTMRIRFGNSSENLLEALHTICWRDPSATPPVVFQIHSAKPRLQLAAVVRIQTIKTLALSGFSETRKR